MHRRMVIRNRKLIAGILYGCLCTPLTLCIFIVSACLYLIYGNAIFAILLLVVCILGVIYEGQDTLVYHPNLPNYSRMFVPQPDVFNMPSEQIFIKSYDGTLLHMYLIKQTNGEMAHMAPTLLFLHGNAGNMGHRLQNVHYLYQNLAVNVLMLEYRGYGYSNGSPTETGLCLDARVALDYLNSRPDINHSKIIVFGRSLGGAVAIDLASRVQYAESIYCLIVENTFTSIPDITFSLSNQAIFKYLPLFCYKNQYLSKVKVKSLRMPCLFISGSKDNLVPPRMMRQLFSACASEHKQLLEYEKGTHNDTWICPQYYENIAQFLDSIQQKTGTVNSQ